MIKQRNKTYFSRDTRGNRLAHLAVNGTKDRAVLLADDLERILEAGWSTNWSLESTGGRHRYVLVWARGPSGKPRTLTVARLVAQAGKGQVVRYADGNRLNLRRENLLVRKGTAWMPVDALTVPGASKSSGQKILPEISERASNPSEPRRSPRTPHVRAGGPGYSNTTRGQAHG
jgi:hypothetical protein